MSFHSGQDPEANLPDWLKALRKRQSQENPSSEKQVPASEETHSDEKQEEPDWLSAIRERHGYSQNQPPSTPTEDAGTKLGDTQPVPANRSEKQDEPIHTAESAVEQLVEEPKAQEPSDIDVQPEQLSREYPEWLQETVEPQGSPQEPVEERKPHIPAFSEGSNEEIAPGELPSWLQEMRPSAEAKTEKVKRENKRPTDAGPLAGLADILPVEPIAAQTIKPPIYSSRIELTDRQSDYVAAFTQILEEENLPLEDRSRQVSVPAYLLNTIMAAVLIISLSVPLITQGHNAPLPVLSTESIEVFNIIEALPAGSPVLIGFDLQPAQYGETQAAASIVLSHLLDRQAQLVFISTQPTGSSMVELLLHQEIGTQPAVATKSYTNLGYLSGGIAALRSFFSNPREASMSMTALGINPWNELISINSVSDFAMVIVITSSADDVRQWIEQGSGSFSNGLIAVTSAQAEPALIPYLQSQPSTLHGMVSGIRGAAAYEQFRSQENGTGRALWDSYSYGLGAILLIVLLGGLYGRIINLKPKQKAGQPRKSSEKSNATESKGGNES